MTACRPSSVPTLSEEPPVPLASLLDASLPVLPAVQLSILERPRRHPPRDLESRAGALLAHVREVCGDVPGLVRSRLETTQALAHVCEDREVERCAAYALGLLFYELGFWNGALERFEAARRAGTPPLGAAWCLYRQARVRIEIAPVDRTLAACARVLRRLGWRKRSPLAMRLRLLAARAYREGGDRRRARRVLDRIAGWDGEAARSDLFPSIRSIEVDLLRDEGRHDAAEAACREVWERLKVFPGRRCPLGMVTAASVLRRWGEVLLALGKIGEARRRVEEGSASLGARELEELGQLEGLEASIRLEEGEEGAAWEAFQTGEEALRKARRPLPLAELLLRCGEVAAIRRTEGQARAEAREGILEARSLFRRLGREEAVRRCDLFLETFRLGRERRDVAARSLPRPPRPPRVPRVRRLSQLGFLTADVEILTALEPLESLARTTIPVLILGESGTGKEVLARALHRAGGGRGPFVAVNCGALPSELQESELFGHVRGAFTGAVAEKTGLFEAADGGTLLLDEVGEMSPRAQVKLLRVLELGEVRRVGETRTRHVQVRVLAATNADLKAQTRSGAFRRDLYYRLCGLKVELPPLRDRLGDVPLLASHFVRLFGNGDVPVPTLAPEALDRLLQHSWPGNVRELRFTVEKAVSWTRALRRERVEADCIDFEPAPEERPVEVPACVEEESFASGGLEAYIENTERRLILKALEENGWNRTRAARSLGGLSRTTLIGKMKRLGLFPGPGAAGPAGDREETESTATPPAFGRGEHRTSCPPGGCGSTTTDGGM